MEYCHYGCLRDHLIKQRCHFIGAFNSSFRENVSLNEAELVVGADEVGYLKAAKSPCGNYKYDRPLTVKDLVCFAFQIARGLEYLHSKKVSVSFQIQSLLESVHHSTNILCITGKHGRIYGDFLVQTLSEIHPLLL